MSNYIQEHARAYSAASLSIVPLQPGTKQPACRWQQFQSRRASTAEIDSMFSDPGVGIGIVTGPASDGLAVRDFDDERAYEKWQTENAYLASSLPTVKTRRGYHVYCRTDVSELAAYSGRPDAKRIDGVDGELSFGGSYVCAPPSTHPTGFVYRLLRGELFSIPYLRFVDLKTLLPEKPLGFSEEKRDAPSPPLHPQQPSCVAVLHEKQVPLSEEIQRIVGLCAVKSGATRNKCQLRLIQRLRGIRELQGVPVECFQNVFTYWWRLSKENMRADFREAWGKFCAAWPIVRYPIFGFGSIKFPIQIPSSAKRYRKPVVRRIIGLRSALSSQSADGRFFLSTHDAARIVKADKSTISRWLHRLEEDGILKRLSTGSYKAGLASEFVYLGGLP